MTRLGRHATVDGLGDLCRGPDQNIGIPDRGDAEFRVGANLDPHVADIVLDRRKARFLGQAEKWPLHRVALVANRNVREIRGEEVGLMIAFGRKPFCHETHPG